MPIGLCQQLSVVSPLCPLLVRFGSRPSQALASQSGWILLFGGIVFSGVLNRQERAQTLCCLPYPLAVWYGDFAYG